MKKYIVPVLAVVVLGCGKMTAPVATRFKDKLTTLGWHDVRTDPVRGSRDRLVFEFHAHGDWFEVGVYKPEGDKDRYCGYYAVRGGHADWKPHEEGLQSRDQNRAWHAALEMARAYDSCR
jgi:hypothetical protein